MQHDHRGPVRLLCFTLRRFCGQEAVDQVFGHGLKDKPIAAALLADTFGQHALVGQALHGVQRQARLLGGAGLGPGPADGMGTVIGEVCPRTPQILQTVGNDHGDALPESGPFAPCGVHVLAEEHGHRHHRFCVSAVECDHEEV